MLHSFTAEAGDVEAQPRQSAGSAAGVSIMLTTFIMLGALLPRNLLQMWNIPTRSFSLMAECAVFNAGHGCVLS